MKESVLSTQLQPCMTRCREQSGWQRFGLICNRRIIAKLIIQSKSSPRGQRRLFDPHYKVKSRDYFYIFEIYHCHQELWKIQIFQFLAMRFNNTNRILYLRINKLIGTKVKEAKVVWLSHSCNELEQLQKKHHPLIFIKS